jgi:hypothetical protein
MMAVPPRPYILSYNFQLLLSRTGRLLNAFWLKQLIYLEIALYMMPSSRIPIEKVGIRYQHRPHVFSMVSLVTRRTRRTDIDPMQVVFRCQIIPVDHINVIASGPRRDLDTVRRSDVLVHDINLPRRHIHH